MFIRTEKATKVYNPGMPDEHAALRSVSVEFEQGEAVVLKGPSGSGKTTLLSLVGCMSRPTSGRVMLEGRDVAKLPERFLTEVRRRTFGFIFQQFHLIGNVSVMENVLLPLYPQTMRTTEMKERALVVLRRFRMEEKAHLKVKQLSGGEQQRVAIARALVGDPRVVVADEPTAHLDAELSQEFMDILADLKREGRTVLVATHDPFVSELPFVTKEVVMRDGVVERVEVR